MAEVEIIPVGGYADFGRNMTAVRVGREIVIFDMGIRLDRILLHEDAVFDDMHPVDLQNLGAIPDDTVLKDVPGKVVAIVIGHGHLDHVGAVGKLAGRYKDAPIYATPYTIKLIEDMVKARGRGKRGNGKPELTIPNRLIGMNPGESREITKDLELEFVHTTHSIVQTVFPVLHTNQGAIVYANDYKFDNSPVIGNPPDYDRLKSLAAEGVLALIVESTNSYKETKTQSESIAREQLRDFLFGIENERDGIIVSTFSSHTARMKSIIEFGEEMGREVWLLGRSMQKYQDIASEVGLLNLGDNVKIHGYARSAAAALKRLQKEGNKEDYLLVATGHQGEPGALVPRIANRELDYRVERDDQIIFSANVIPNPVNQANRHVLETKLKMQGARIIKGAHVSGHASREDHRELLKYLEPQHIFPAHGGIDLQTGWVEIGERRGYTLNESLHILRNGQRYKF